MKSLPQANRTGYAQDHRARYNCQFLYRLLDRLISKCSKSGGPIGANDDTIATLNPYD